MYLHCRGAWLQLPPVRSDLCRWCCLLPGLLARVNSSSFHHDGMSYELPSAVCCHHWGGSFGDLAIKLPLPLPPWVQRVLIEEENLIITQLSNSYCILSDGSPSRCCWGWCINWGTVTDSCQCIAVLIPAERDHNHLDYSLDLPRSFSACKLLLKSLGVAWRWGMIYIPWLCVHREQARSYNI